MDKMVFLGGDRVESAFRFALTIAGISATVLPSKNAQVTVEFDENDRASVEAATRNAFLTLKLPC